MLLVHPSLISEIDKYAEDILGIPQSELMGRAGRAVADAVRAYTATGGRVVIFAGKGNNGGDGYAAALELMRDYRVTVYDVFSAGQRSDAGRYFLDAFFTAGGAVESLDFSSRQLSDIAESDCIVDAVFGTGFFGELPDIVIRVAEIIALLEGKVRIAVDVPLGVDAALGRVSECAKYKATATVVLGFIKLGLISYPAKEYVGNIIYDNIGLHNEGILSRFSFNSYYVDDELALSLLPKREQNSSKGSFGRLLAMTGSCLYPGAARLSLEAALRSGVGYVTYLGDKELCDSLLPNLPETIYTPVSVADATSEDISEIVDISARHTAVLLGSGSSRTPSLYRLTERLLMESGAPLVLDADAINVLSDDPRRGRELIRTSPRRVILTPHPLELSRISGLATDYIQANRLEVATDFARENNCILVLKGAATVVTDGKEIFVNSSGSSALAKAGSGDVLAGHLAALVASGLDPLRASALAVYLHGSAADVLAEELSELGVIPSDLPREIAHRIAALKRK